MGQKPSQSPYLNFAYSNVRFQGAETNNKSIAKLLFLPQMLQIGTGQKMAACQCTEAIWLSSVGASKLFGISPLAREAKAIGSMA
jgi:hypothetical protein